MKLSRTEHPQQQQAPLSKLKNNEHPRINAAHLNEGFVFDGETDSGVNSAVNTLEFRKSTFEDTSRQTDGQTEKQTDGNRKEAEDPLAIADNNNNNNNPKESSPEIPQNLEEDIYGTFSPQSEFIPANSDSGQYQGSDDRDGNPLYATVNRTSIKVKEKAEEDDTWL